MSPSETPTPVLYRQPAEALEAVRSLSKGEKSILMKVARTYATIRRTRFEPDDLVQEAVARILEGTRRWPHDVPFMAFVCGVMRGIAWDWRRDATDDAEIDEVAGAGEGDAVAAIDAQNLMAIFSDDPVAQTILLGLMEGARGEELWAASGLTRVEYESKRKKVRRRIERVWFVDRKVQHSVPAS